MLTPNSRFLSNCCRFCCATVCKTVHATLSDRCPVCAVCLSVCDVGLLWLNGWMDQDATWYGDRPRPRPHCARWGPSSPTQKGHSPQFLAHVYCGQIYYGRTAVCIRIPLDTEVGLSLVCLFVSNFAQKLQTDLCEIFREGWQCISEQMVKLWWRSGSPSGYTGLFTGFVTIGRYGKWYQPTALRDAAVQGMH